MKIPHCICFLGLLFHTCYFKEIEITWPHSAGGLSKAWATDPPHACIACLFFSHARLGAFLIPYILCLILAGVPTFLMEMSVGQVMQTNAVTAWKRLCPLFGGTWVIYIYIYVFSDNTWHHIEQHSTAQCNTTTPYNATTQYCATQPKQHTTHHFATQHCATQHCATQHWANTTQHWANTTLNNTLHNTAQHNTAQHSTAQHNIEQHSTAQHNTVLLNATQWNAKQHTTITHKPQQYSLKIITFIVNIFAFFVSL